MARPAREAPTPSALVPALLRYVAAQGRDAAFLAARFDLSAGAADQDEVKVAPSVASDMLEAAAELLAEPFLALRLPAELPLRGYGLAELAARASSTLRDSLVQTARYASLVHPHLAFELVEHAGGAGEAGEACWYQRTPAHVRGIGRHAHEYGLAYVLTHMRAAAARPIAPLRVWFAHARPRDLAPLHRFFATQELAFGEVDSGLALPAALLDEPLATSDARLLATVTGLADEALRASPRGRELAPRVAAHLRTHLPDDASADRVARALHMSARTLQRRLEGEGTSFTEVLDGTREELARALLADPALSLGEIGYRIGFADLASFSRAFRRWTGMPPGQFRRHLAP
jgi:AraC-like DNA-binding protein